MRSITAILILIIFACTISAQTGYNPTLASRLLYFNSAGLIEAGVEVLLPLSDSSSNSYNYSMKTLRHLYGTYYNVLSSRKEGDGLKVYLRKSTNGINWSELIKVGDSPKNINESIAGVYVWEKGGNINVGVTYQDNRDSDYQLRFSLSTDGGNTFDSSIEISSHSGSSHIWNGALEGKGDTLVACWVPQFGSTQDNTFFNYSTNGGQTWNAMMQAFDALYSYSEISDLTIDSEGNVCIVIGDDQWYRKNLVVRYTTDLGTSWQTKTQITNQASPNINSFQQIKYFNSKHYVIWVHSFWSAMADSVFFSVSSDGGNTWREKSHISDTDTLTGISYPFFTHPSFDISPDGNIYAVWADSRERNNVTMENSRFNVYLSRSTDDGITWSPSICVNDSDFVYNRNNYADVSVKSNGGIDTVLVTWTKYRNASTTGISQQENVIPSDFNLSQNFPNPFNPTTTISFSIPKQNHVSLKVYDVLGNEVGTLVNEEKEIGVYSVYFNASQLASGIYFYQIKAGAFNQIKKMLLIK